MDRTGTVYSQTGNSLNLNFDGFYWRGAERRGLDGIGLERTGGDWKGRERFTLKNNKYIKDLLWKK